MRFFLFVFFIFLFSLNLQASIKDEIYAEMIKTHTSPITSYREAREILFGYLHYNNGIIKDYYCNQIYTCKNGVNENQIPDHTVLNCEHAHPRSKFNSKKNYNMQLCDLHHLFPVASRSNSIRSNLPFGNIDESGKLICNQSKKGYIKYSQIYGFEPPLNRKGDIARALFYFSIRYQTPIHTTEEYWLKKWNKEDPVDKDEKIRDEKISQIQGNHNPFIIKPFLVDKISDF